MSRITLAEAMDRINVGPSRLAREAGEPVSTVSDLRSGRIKSPGYQLVRRVYDALVRLGLSADVTLEDVFPVEHVADSAALVGAASSGNSTVVPESAR